MELLSECLAPTTKLDLRDGISSTPLFQTTRLAQLHRIDPFPAVFRGVQVWRWLGKDLGGVRGPLDSAPLFHVVYHPVRHVPIEDGLKVAALSRIVEVGDGSVAAPSPVVRDNIHVWQGQYQSRLFEASCSPPAHMIVLNTIRRQCLTCLS